MPENPFDIISCSWPRAVEVSERQWDSEPEWDTPLMPFVPQPRWRRIEGGQCWTINWREFFNSDLKHGCRGGEMRGFHVVFRIRVNGSGKLIFWDDDGSFVRRNGEVIHADRTSHVLTRHEIDVSAGDCLQVAHWQLDGDWMWGARLVPVGDISGEALRLFLPYLEKVQRRLRDPNGPPLKMFFSGNTPVRTVLCIYSMILNGYSPSRVVIYGEHQWSESSRRLFKELLPFAEVVPSAQVNERIEKLGGAKLLSLARNWFVLKTCVCVLCAPEEFCFMDDDVFILNPLNDALRAFESCDLVYAPDADYTEGYMRTWGWLYEGTKPLPTGKLNAGLYLLRNRRDPKKLAPEMLRVGPYKKPAHFWEQGFLACCFGNEKILALSSQRYLFPIFDGLPGGVLRYDYARNPCGFVSVHFGGLHAKPTDAAALILAPGILGKDK